MSRSPFAPAAAMIGDPSKKEKRAASARASPRKSPAVIVAPDRETPGMSAPAWANPITTASETLRLSISRM